MLLGELWKLDASVKPSTLMVMLSYLTMNLQVSLGQENGTNIKWIIVSRIFSVTFVQEPLLILYKQVLKVSYTI